MSYWTDGDKSIGVLGMGRSGRAAAALLKLRGFAVTGLDSCPVVADCPDCDGMVTGDDDIADFLVHLDGIVLSPGVDPSSRIPETARDLGLPVIGEIELAFRNSDMKVLAVTGSNGKTTTAEWLAHTLRSANLYAVAAGNTGYPFSTAVIEHPDAEYVSLEVSSYQLQTIDTFRPSAAAILNITPDHLQRHGDFESYMNVKARVFMNQHDDDVLVLNRDDPGLVPLAGRTEGLEWFFSTGRMSGPGAFADHGRIYMSEASNAAFIMDASGLSLPGEHNLSNALAVVCLASSAGVPPEMMVEGLSTFPGVRHRIEAVRELRGVSYVNDSKSTNPESLAVALRSFDRPVVLIAGGLAKKADYGALAELIAERVISLVLIGKAADMLAGVWTGRAPVHMEETLDRAVARASAEARPGDVVLLSPGCASFDQYSSFEERGEHFRGLVEALR